MRGPAHKDGLQVGYRPLDPVPLGPLKRQHPRAHTPAGVGRLCAVKDRFFLGKGGVGGNHINGQHRHGADGDKGNTCPLGGGLFGSLFPGSRLGGSLVGSGLDAYYDAERELEQLEGQIRGASELGSLLSNIGMKTSVTRDHLVRRKISRY